METNQKKELMQLMATASPQQLIQSDLVAERFKNLYQTIHGAKDGERFYEAEKFHFLKLLQETPKLQTCTKLSLYGCFMDVAVNGLSFDPSFKHLYIVPFNANMGTKQEPKWETRATIMISGYGELVLRKQQGQIKYADNPVLVYNGDVFEYGTENDKAVLTHKAKFPRKSDEIIACYIRITRNDGSTDYKVLSIDEILQFKKFSKDPNSKAWVDGLPGMVQTKTIKHAFKSYPKVRAGEFSQLASNTVDTETEIINAPEKIDYGIPSSEEKETTNNKPQLQDDSFLTESKNNSAPVYIDEDAF